MPLRGAALQSQVSLQSDRCELLPTPRGQERSILTFPRSPVTQGLVAPAARRARAEQWGAGSGSQGATGHTRLHLLIPGQGWGSGCWGSPGLAPVARLCTVPAFAALLKGPFQPCMLASHLFPRSEEMAHTHTLVGGVSLRGFPEETQAPAP